MNEQKTDPGVLQIGIGIREWRRWPWRHFSIGDSFGYNFLNFE